MSKTDTDVDTDTTITKQDNDIEERTVLSTEASVESLNAYLFHACLTCAVIESSFNLGARGTLQYARLLQLVLIVQQPIHELLHLEKNTLIQVHQIMCRKDIQKTSSPV